MGGHRRHPTLTGKSAYASDPANGVDAFPGDQDARHRNEWLYSEILSAAASSPMMPRRNASTQIMKITPWVTVTQAPNCAR